MLVSKKKEQSFLLNPLYNAHMVSTLFIAVLMIPLLGELVKTYSHGDGKMVEELIMRQVN